MGKIWCRKIISIFLFVLLVLTIVGCTRYTEEEITVQDQAANAAEKLMEEKTQDIRLKLFLADYSPESFVFKKMEGEDVYIISGTYICGYGIDTRHILFSVKMKEQFRMQQNADGTWARLPFDSSKEDANEVLQIVSSDVEKMGDDVITSLEDGDYEPFLSRAEAEGLSTTEIAGKILCDYLDYFAVLDRENQSFWMINGGASGNPQIELCTGDAEDGVKSKWKIHSSIRGLFIGYIEGIGYGGPFFDLNWPDEMNETNEIQLMQGQYYMIETEEGYYLKAGE